MQKSSSLLTIVKYIQKNQPKFERRKNIAKSFYNNMPIILKVFESKFGKKKKNIAKSFYNITIIVFFTLFVNTLSKPTRAEHYFTDGLIE